MSQDILEQIAEGRTDLVFPFIEVGHAACVVSEGGVSILKWCAYYGDVSAIRFLLSHGESLHSLGDNYDLNGAVFHGHQQLSRYLIDLGADVIMPLPDTGETPLHAVLCTADRRSPDLVLRLLLESGANPNCTTRQAVETGAFMRDVRTRGEAPLHRAAAYGTEETIRLLLDAGAKVDARDMNGDSPLSWASWHLRPRPILRMLCFGNFHA